MIDNGGCEHTCVNTIPSFFCTCNDGYILDDNGRNCNGKNYTYIHYTVTETLQHVSAHVQIQMNVLVTLVILMQHVPILREDTIARVKAILKEMEELAL